MTSVAIVQSNPVGALVFGGMTLSLLWFALRPKRPAAAEAYPLRAAVGWALAATAAAAAMVLYAVFDDTKGRGLAMAAAIYGIPFAIMLWVLVRRMWRSGFRMTRSEAEDARDQEDGQS